MKVLGSRQNLILSRALQISLWSAGLAFFAWASMDSRFRDPDGFLNGTICLPIAVGLALVVLGWGIAGPLRNFAFWFALALVGQSVSLQLIDAGPLLHYQHYRIPDFFTGTNSLLLVFLALQTIAVIAGFRTRRITARVRLTRNLKLWQLLGIALVFVLSSAALSRDVVGYVIEVTLAAFVQLVNLGAVVLMVAALPEGTLVSLRSRFDALFGQPAATGASEPGGLDRFALLAALWVTAVTSLLAVAAYQQHPHVQDEVAYLMQARYLAAGALELPAPPVQQAFGFYLMQFNAAQWFPVTPPGWPAVLALGVRIGIPWLVDPLLGGISVLLAYLFIRELYDRRTARLVLVLLAISPWFLFMGMNIMTHTFTLTCALAAGVLLAWTRRTGNTLWAVLAGLMVGMGSLIRPLDGLLTALVLGLWVIGLGGKRLKFRALAAFVIATGLVAAVVLPFNQALTGKATVFPLNAYIDAQFGPGRNDMGFGPNRGLGWPLQPFQGHSPLGAMVNTALNIFSINTELLGWSTGSLLFLALWLFSGRRRTSDYLMLAVIAITIGTFSLYWYSGGPDFGARYWYLVLIPCLVLTVRGIELVQERLTSGPEGTGLNGTRVLVAVVVLCAFTLITYIPWRAIDKYSGYLGMRPEIQSLAQEYGFGKSLVLVRGAEVPDYASAAIYNPLDWKSDAPVYAWSRSAGVEADVVKAFADRPVWIVDGPSITHGNWKVVAGPLPAQQVLAHGSNVP